MKNFKIDQILPNSNTKMETEIHAMLSAREALYPEHFTDHCSRLRMHRVTPKVQGIDLLTVNCKTVYSKNKLTQLRICKVEI
jgi:maleate isomerase